MSGGTDYTYDEQGQFFPYFIVTLTSFVTIPVTYSLLKPSKELESTATRLSTDFTPEHADLIDNQRKKQRRRERRIKRAIVSVLGWSIIAGMIYLIAVTARTAPKNLGSIRYSRHFQVFYRKADQIALPKIIPH